mgnify:CR=1 FL=1
MSLGSQLQVGLATLASYHPSQVGWAEIFGYVCFIPDVVMGLTILAAGTSVRGSKW